MRLPRESRGQGEGAPGYSLLRGSGLLSQESGAVPELQGWDKAKVPQNLILTPAPKAGPHQPPLPYPYPYPYPRGRGEDSLGQRGGRAELVLYAGGDDLGGGHGRHALEGFVLGDLVLGREGP